MDDVKKNSDDGWKSATQLAVRYVGGSKKINLRLLELKKRLIADITDQINIDELEASAIVAQNLIRNDKPMGGTEGTVIRAAPEAVSLLELEPRSRKNTPAQCGWTTITTLMQSHLGNHAGIVKKLQNLRSELVHDIVTQGKFAEEEAVALVERYFVGDRKRSPTSPGLGGMYGSENAIELLEREGVLRRRPKSVESVVDRISRSNHEMSGPSRG